MRVRSLTTLFLILLTAACSGPLPFMSGGRLSGEAQPAPAVWMLADDYGMAQLETRPAEPYSVNLAFTQIEGRLYVFAGDTETQWVRNMDADPRVRLRLSDALYSARAARVRDPREVSSFANAWKSSSMFHRDPAELEEVWLYRLLPPDV